MDTVAIPYIGVIDVENYKSIVLLIVTAWFVRKSISANHSSYIYYLVVIHCSSRYYLYGTYIILEVV